MNPQSPGANSIQNVIEMTSLENNIASSPVSVHQNVHQDESPQNAQVEDSDEEDDLVAEGTQALLGSPQHDWTGRQVAKSAGELWSQVRSIALESAPTLLLTTIGLLFTGKLLDRVAHWRAMKEVHQLIMIIPVILNLKGNLEMNLSARLGTAANVGELDDPTLRRSLVLGNLSLLQVQAAVVSFISACIALVLGLALPRITSEPLPLTSSNSTTSANITARAIHSIAEFAILNSRRPIPPPPKDSYGTLTLTKVIMVASTAMTAACLSSIVLGSFMCTLIIVCRKYGRDPDNIAPPIAACLGDLVTLLFIGITSSLLIRVINTPIPFILGIVIILFAVICFVLTVRNKNVRPLLTQGWSPLFGAMVISSGTGVVLDRFVSRYEGFALLAIVISGVPGSVGCILVSRLSTSLHAAALSITPRSTTTAGGKRVQEPSMNLVMATLLLVTVPIEIIFLTLLHSLGWLTLPFAFVSLSVFFFFLAVVTSLFVARTLTNYLWSKQRDPDMYALPIHSALMDLVGQMLLALCFEIVQYFNKAPRIP